MGNCYGWETWCHMNCHINFIDGLVGIFITWKSSIRWITSFLVLKKLISISLIAYVFTKVFMFIVHSICSALSCRLSAQFFPQLPHGCFACCCLNMSFIHNLLLKSKTLPAVYADLVKPWISKNISVYFSDVTFSKILGKLHIIPDIILKNKGCFVPVTADTVRKKLTWKFVNCIKYNNFLFF